MNTRYLCNVLFLGYIILGSGLFARAVFTVGRFLSGDSEPATTRPSLLSVESPRGFQASMFTPMLFIDNRLLQAMESPAAPMPIALVLSSLGVSILSAVRPVRLSTRNVL
ncbi:MAG: hypothetical protein JW828_11095 [Sedimentisphaerales bacterium]|nr:hypothetical protein [Sedimentisphaerales bacterium]